MPDYSSEAAVIREAVQRDEEEFQRAVDELKEAVNRPFQAVERIAATPLPWMFAAFLVGLWLGGHGHVENRRHF